MTFGAVLLALLLQASQVTIRDEGTHVCRVHYIDFVGAGVTATCPAGVGTITIPGGGGSSHELLSATHTDTTAATVVRGDIITGQAASPFWKRLALGGTGTFLRSDGTDLLYATIGDGDVPNTITIDQATLALTGDSATGFFSAGLLEVARGGTGSAPGADDQLLVSDSTAAATWKTLTTCTGAGKAITYDASTNTFGCNTITPPSPASTVTDETTLGIATAVGTGTDYARNDHTHGSPSESTIEAAVDLPDLQGTLTVAKGGTGAAPGADDQVLVADSTVAATWRAIADCDDSGGNHLNYDTATNTFSCGTSGGSAGGGWTDGGTTVGLTTVTDMVNAGDNVGIDTAPAADKALVISTSGSKMGISVTNNDGTTSYPAVSITNLASSGYGLQTTSDFNWLSGANVFGTFSSPVNTVDVNGSFGLRQTPIAVVNGDNNNVAISGLSHIRFTGPTAAFAITGITLGAHGRVLILLNGTSQVMTLRHESASSTAANRISIDGGADIVAARALLIYDPNGSRWNVVAYTPAPTGAPGSANFVEAEIDFGATGNTNTSVAVAAAWVTGTSKILCAPTMLATADRTEGAEDAIIEGLTVAAHSRSAGVGFTLAAAAATGKAYGKFKVHCTGS